MVNLFFLIYFFTMNGGTIGVIHSTAIIQSHIVANALT